ncbi:MAG: hypothetical protein UW70_C0066G0002 [Candidatus Peregrinibacteria bacterium GW2011_GWA2_44_7]|nr:MAG: hypothetical protein UW70_C0066G0002 [Candidatus Peregrinibacteria bacterium GW2011_GWA2_44_7]
MQYQELKERLKDFAVFSLADIRKIEANFYRSRLNQWQDKGYIKKLRRGYYLFSDEPLSEEALFLIANRLYEPSYVSLEMAFSRYGLIPESVYAVTSVASKKTSSFQTPIATFSYRRMKPGLLFGYRLESFRNQKYKIAEMEKAVLDYLYINSDVNDEAAFEGLRFNGEAFLAKADMGKLLQYADAFKNKRLRKRLDDFLEFLKRSK